jgi:hypothetical protein
MAVSDRSTASGVIMKTEKQLQYEADLKAKGFTLFDIDGR